MRAGGTRFPVLRAGEVRGERGVLTGKKEGLLLGRRMGLESRAGLWK